MCINEIDFTLLFCYIFSGYFTVFFHLFIASDFCNKLTSKQKLDIGNNMPGPSKQILIGFCPIQLDSGASMTNKPHTKFII